MHYLHTRTGRGQMCRCTCGFFLADNQGSFFYSIQQDILPIQFGAAVRWVVLCAWVFRVQAKSAQVNIPFGPLRPSHCIFCCITLWPLSKTIKYQSFHKCNVRISGTPPPEVELLRIAFMQNYLNEGVQSGRAPLSDNVPTPFQTVSE